MALNITTAAISSGCSAAFAAPSLFQWDQGQILKIEGVALPETYQVEFCCQGDAETLTMLGSGSGVQIPDSLLARGLPIFAYLVLHEGENDRETEYKITIYVQARAEPTDIEPDPGQQSLIDQTIAALNAASSSVSQYKADMINNAGNVMEEIGTFAERPSPQLTCAWSNGNTQVHISGTATYQNPIGIYSTTESGILPPLEVGTEYELVFGSDSDLIKAFLWLGDTEQELTGNTKFTIPDAETYFEFGILVEPGTIDNNAVIGIPFPMSHMDLHMDPITNEQIDALFS